MGNVMLLKPFETSLSSIVYKVKGEVKVKREGKAEHSKFQTRRWGWFSHAHSHTLKDGGRYGNPVIHSNLPLLREEVHQIIPLLLLLF